MLVNGYQMRGETWLAQNRGNRRNGKSGRIDRGSGRKDKGSGRVGQESGRKDRRDMCGCGQAHMTALFT